MLASTDDFRERCKHGHTLVTTVHVLQNEQEVQELTTTISGTVTEERGVDIRTTMDLALVDRDGTLTPRNPYDLLAPLGNGLRVRTGLVYPDGSQELLPVFTGRMGSSGGAWPQVPLKAYDPMRSLQRNKLTYPLFVPPGTRYDKAIEQLINSQLPAPDVNFASSDYLVPPGGLTFVGDDDPADGSLVIGVAEDTDPTSPTYVGRYGRVTYPMTSPYVATNAQAVQAAQARLRVVRGIARKVVLQCLPLPFLKAGDTVHLDYSRSGISANFVIDRKTLPVGARGGPMELTLRARQELPTP